jgi:hypothetical protein
MCIPPVDEEPALHFRPAGQDGRAQRPAKVSMGMSADYETAVRLGATHVRVGTRLFGHADLTMPELPEVETVRRGLVPRWSGGASCAAAAPPRPARPRCRRNLPNGSRAARCEPLTGGRSTCCSAWMTATP